MTDFVSLVIPVLNEERHLKGCLEALSGQVTPDKGEIIVVDGRSSDRSRDIVGACMQTCVNVRLLDNAARLQSAGVNLAAIQADPRSTIIIRADAHAAYPDDFVKNCVASLRHNHATSVVVPMIAAGEDGFQSAAAFAQNDRLGNGGSSHRRRANAGFIEHGHHAAFDRTFFLGLGGYDETFTHNEDAEHDVRAVQAGGSLWMCPDAAIIYYPRATIRGLARQYRNHGAGRARTLLLHRRKPRLRQLAPVLILLATVSALMVAPFTTWPLLIPSAYLLLCCARGAWSAIVQRRPWLLAVGPALVVMHLAWGFGFLSRLARHVGQQIQPAAWIHLRQRES